MTLQSVHVMGHMMSIALFTLYYRPADMVLLHLLDLPFRQFQHPGRQ